MQIGNSSNLNELRSLLLDEDIQSVLSAQGASSIPTSVDDKDMFVRVIARHILIDSTRSLFEDFKNGLNTLNVLESVQRYPEQYRDIFTTTKIQPMDASTVDLMFTINYAEPGSNARRAQELAVVYWRDYLQDCESE